MRCAVTVLASGCVAVLAAGGGTKAKVPTAARTYVQGARRRLGFLRAAQPQRREGREAGRLDAASRSLHHPPRSRLRSPLTRARAAPVRAPDNTIKIWSMAPLLSESADADPAVDKVRRTPRWLVPPNRAAAAAATVATCPDRS